MSASSIWFVVIISTQLSCDETPSRAFRKLYRDGPLDTFFGRSVTTWLELLHVFLQLVSYPQHQYCLRGWGGEGKLRKQAVQGFVVKG
jgi:hypothetical protein